MLLFAVGLFALPVAAYAAVPFFGPIVPEAYNRCAAGWGLLMLVINNLISFLLTIVIVFIAPLMIAYAGFLFVFNPVNASGKEEAKKILTNTIVGIVIALAGWMIVDAVMAVLYNPKDAGSTWTNLITTGGGDFCIPLKASLNQAQQTGVPTPGITVTCSVPELTGITDPLALQMEGGQTVIWENTDPRLRTCVNKFLGKAGGNVTSAYRPQAYQAHLFEIRDRWCTQDLRSNSNTVCSSLRNTVSTEVVKHFGSAWSCGAVAATVSNHSTGIGVDISGINHSSTAVQQAASDSCLTWQNYSGDPYHYDLKPGCSCQ